MIQTSTASIIGVAHHVPERLVTNQYFNDLYKKDLDTFLKEKRNIHQRYFMSDIEKTSDLIIPAAKKAITKANLKTTDIDLIIVATDTPDYISPSTASVVQFQLGATNSGCFDINSACAGFVTALDMANKYIVSDSQYNNILVIGAYGMSRYLDWDDYKIASMFADGAGACVVSRTSDKQSGFLASQLYADGQYHDYMGIYAGGTAQPLSHETIENKAHLLNFAKKIPIETNAVQWPRLTHSLLDRIHESPEKIDHFFLTQLNIETIQIFLDELKLPQNKSHNVMDQFGYTGSACIPMALSDACEKHKLKKGDLVFMLGSGGGMSMAALAMVWGYDT
jgi:3-oxoacyl-[acyl-carrier-protein] synthase III